ncbi:hypothetical protein TNCV_1632711 [Trichonephila clavipes]|nr:hypothetical protein TNCV_1632711 [Trichonephila clavipes]
MLGGVLEHDTRMEDFRPWNSLEKCLCAPLEGVRRQEISSFDHVTQSCRIAPKAPCRDPEVADGRDFEEESDMFLE